MGCLLWSCVSFAQEQADLWQLLDTLEEPAARSEVYSDLSWNYIASYNDSALITAQLAEQDAISHGDLQGQAIAREYKGLYYEMVKNNYGLASQIYLEAIAFCEENNLHYDRSLYHSLGILFHTTDNYEKAKTYYNKSLKLARARGDSSLIMKCLTNLGTINSSQGNHETARQLMLESLSIKTDNQDAVYATYGNIGNSYYRQDSFEQALPWLYKSVGAIPHQDYPADAILHSYLLDAKTALGDFDKMDYWIDRTLQAANLDSSNLRQQVIAYKAIAAAHQGMGDFKSSNEYYQTYIKQYDQLKSQQRDALVLDLEEKYETEKREFALNKKARQNQILGGFLIFSTLLLTALAILFFKNSEKSKLLDVQNVALKKSVEEKNTLLKEVHHRVKNNLQVVSSLFSLQSRYIKHPEAKEVLAKGKDRVRSMALLHQNLYQEGNFTYVNTRNYFSNLIDQLFKSYAIRDQQIRLEKNIDDLDLSLDSMLSLGLITNELISNALKHAWPEGQQGHLMVSLREIDNHLLLEVKDDGIGQPRNEEITDSLGSKLINSFASKLRATITISRQSGYHFQMRLAKYSKKKALEA